MLQREKIVSSGQILGDLRPKLFFRKLNAFLESITPEEVETLVIIKNVKIPKYSKNSKNSYLKTILCIILYHRILFYYNLF